ncbi:MAG TPA: LemA family protein, partial [Vicinamibacterales bacterium]|nr:LemA family protein [Vicinamibacterales bacterium]
VPTAVAVAGVVIYNGLVIAKQSVREAWGAVDVHLQRRASLIPNLVETVKGYAQYERDTLKTVVEARGALTAASGPRAAAQANDTLGRAIGSVLAIAEQYPQLKANESYAKLQTDLADTENKIAYARNYYNGAVEIYNVKVQSFPGVLVARMGGFAPAEFFRADEAAAKPVEVRP